MAKRRVFYFNNSTCRNSYHRYNVDSTGTGSGRSTYICRFYRYMYDLHVYQKEVSSSYYVNKG